ncbi:MAG: Peroxiredoxin, partial [Chloroflexi bacterium]|nr:Peroxiredoxin [Chloroflexota bacterium]
LIEEEGVALRGLAVIDPDGIVQYEVVHNLNIGRSVDETLRVIQGLQTGGRCSANWRPGQNNL